MTTTQPDSTKGLFCDIILAMKAALYLRVSTTEQDTANQLPALEEYARRRGFEIVQTYSEKESAWKNGHQVELASLFEDARRGKFDVVLVWALDRLSREGALAILSLVDRLKKYGAKVISLQESWTEAPGDLADILYAIAGWVAKMESERRSARTIAGLQRIKANGKALGRPKGSKDKRQRSRRGYLLRYAK
jgi:putative DNA-invertase from lambdoid prophage Rac